MKRIFSFVLFGLLGVVALGLSGPGGCGGGGGGGEGGGSGGTDEAPVTVSDDVINGDFSGEYSQDGCQARVEQQRLRVKPDRFREFTDGSFGLRRYRGILAPSGLDGQPSRRAAPA